MNLDQVSRRQFRAMLASSMGWLLGFSLAFAQAAEPAPAPRVPVEAFGQLPALTDVALAPDGRHTAGLLNDGERTVLVTREVAGGDVKQVMETDNLKFHFDGVHWVNDHRLVISVRFPAQRGFVGTEETRLFAVDADGGKLVNLANRLLNVGRTRVQQRQDRVIDWLPQDGQHVLLDLPDTNRVDPAVYEVDVDTGLRHMMKSSEQHVRRWLSDAQHRVRIGVRQVQSRDTTTYEIRGCDPDGKNWHTLWTFNDPSDGVWPIGFGLDPQELWVEAQQDGRQALFTVRLDQPDLPRTLRLADPRFDVEGRLLRSPDGAVIGLRSGSDREPDDQSRSDLWDPAWQGVARDLDQRLPQRDNQLLDISRDGQRYLVFSSGNGQPGEFFLGDRADHSLTLVGKAYPALVPAQLARKELVNVPARDGLSLDAYLTLPVGHRQDAGPLPFVLLPHGGPQVRNGRDFDAWTAFLANRGYAVLQVNFRGSTGYGRDFMEAGLQRWGLEMQDDLSDAVKWAVAQGVADPKRVCIVGADYGGYAALMGLAKTPELYRCGVSVGGPSNLVDLVRFRSEFVGGKAAARRSIGDAWDDSDKLRATSPALLVDRIRAPVLLVHGTDDRRIPVAQSEDMAEALRHAGKPYQFLEQENGDHQMDNNGQRLEFFRTLERFLDQNLKNDPAE
jgi:dipeptidyl aminopeptidase/acylaminoacyl peptidase